MTTSINFTPQRVEQSFTRIPYSGVAWTWDNRKSYAYNTVFSYYRNWIERDRVSRKGNFTDPTAHFRFNWKVKQIYSVGRRRAAYLGEYYASDPNYSSISMPRNGATYTGLGGCGLYNENDVTAAVESAALSKFRSNDVNMSTTIAESMETANYIASIASDVFKFLRAVKTARPSLVKSFIYKRFSIPRRQRLRGANLTTAKLWLEYNYAIKPLVGDINNYLRLYSEGIITNNDNDRPWIVSGRSRRLLTVRRTSETSDVRHTAEAYVTVTTKLFATVDNAGLLARSQLGITQSDLLLAAWEIVPFSFVLDWAIPIGDFIEAHLATQGLKYRSGYTSIRVRELGYTMPVDMKASTYSATFTSVCDWYWRRLLTSFPLPVLQFKDPRSYSHIMTAASLFTVLRKS